MKYELAIFDLDGTILNTLQDLADSCNHVLKKFQLPRHTEQEIRFMVGNGIPKLIERAVPQGKENPQYEKILETYIEYYKNHNAIKTAPYAGIAEIFSKMKALGIKLAVNTNKLSSAAENLCERYFPGVFDSVCGSSPEIPVKPAPDGVQKILTQLCAKKEKTVYVGDSEVDVLTAKNAGIDVISVAWGFRGEEFLKERGATLVVKNANELFCKIISE